MNQTFIDRNELTLSHLYYENKHTRFHIPYGLGLHSCLFPLTSLFGYEKLLFTTISLYISTRSLNILHKQRNFQNGFMFFEMNLLFSWKLVAIINNNQLKIFASLIQFV